MKKTEGRVPGVMLYADAIETMKELPAEAVAEIIFAMYDYAVFNREPELTSDVKLIWPFIRTKLDLDKIHYNETCEKRRYAAYVRKCRGMNTIEKSFEEWKQGEAG